MDQNSKPILGYWDFRGLGQPIRLLLTYLDVDFIDKRYSTDNLGEQWFVEKFTLGLDFPNLPYYFDGDTKLTQTMTIMSYIARKYQLDGKTEQERNAIFLIANQLQDSTHELYLITYDPNHECMKHKLLEDKLPDQLRALANYMRARKFVAGSEVSWVDFYLYEYLVKINVLECQVLEKHDCLRKFIKRVEALPRIREFIAGKEPAPINSPWAKWNGSY